MPAYQGERMPSMTTMIESEHAPRYLQTLCRHFGRKVEASWDEQTGRVHFPAGVCDMQVQGTQLRVTCHADDEANLTLVTETVSSHIEMFARREALPHQWQCVADA